jgi:hypothetical protein
LIQEEFESARAMLIQSLLRMRSRRAIVRDAYRKYLKSTRYFMKWAGERAVKVAPDQSAALLKCFRMQVLMNEQQSIRFESLLKSNFRDWALLKSLDAIAQRLGKDWSAAEDEALIQRNSHYRDVSQEIKDIQANWDFDSLTEPLRVLDQDPQYRAERLTIADSVEELQRRIA